MKFLVYSFDDLDVKMWATLESQARHTSVFQTYSWAKVLKSIGTEPYFLILTNKERPVLGLLMSRSRLIRGVLHGYEAMGGPLQVSEVDEEDVSVFASFLKSMMEKKSVLYFYWCPSLYLNIESFFLSRGFLPIPSATFVLDLRLPLETLWRNLEKNTRWGVKKAERSGVNVTEAESWSDWSKYYSIYLYESFRKGVRARSIALHKSIHKLLMPEGKAKLLLAKRGNKIIAGTLSLLTSDEIIDYEGGSDVRYLSLYPNNAVQWYSIRWAEEQGIKHYDFGGALWNPEKKSFLYGIHMFKKQWGGTLRKFNSLARNKLYVIERQLSFKSSKIRRLYYTLEKLKMIERSDRI